MQKWEYGELRENVGKQTIFNTVTQLWWQGQSVKKKRIDFMNELGSEGWELVSSSAAVYSYDTVREYIFKRPLE
jgi:hypothetical protein